MTEEIARIAHEYLTAREQAKETEYNIDTLRDERDDWKSKMESLDEDDPLYDVAKENFDQLEETINNARESKDKSKNQEEELLRATSERFIPTGEWTNGEVLKALNTAVLEKPLKSIHINTTEISTEAEIEDDEVLFEVATTVRDVAKEKMGDPSKLEEFWQDFQQLDRFEYFKIISASDEPLTGGDIAEELGEEDRRQAISQGLIDTTKGPVNPYYKQGRGEYSLSFVGEFLIHEYGEDSLSMPEESDSEQESDSDDDATLNSFE